MILSDFRCPVHGVFETLADADAETMPCPHLRGFQPTLSESENLIAEKLLGLERCDIPSPWSPSPVFGQVQLVSAVTGKWEKPPTPQHCDVMTTLGEGQRYGEWRAGRKKMWRDHDYKRRKDRG